MDFNKKKKLDRRGIEDLRGSEIKNWTQFSMLRGLNSRVSNEAIKRRLQKGK